MRYTKYMVVSSMIKSGFAEEYLTNVRNQGMANLRLPQSAFDESYAENIMWSIGPLS